MFTNTSFCVIFLVISFMFYIFFFTALHYPPPSLSILHPFTPEHHNCHHHLSQANLELNDMEYKREEEDLRKLEKPYSVLEVECNQILEKRRLAEEKRKEEMRELELKTKAAIFAQAWWRGYSTRKALKNKGKSKKAKKGKGKKTK